MEVQEELLVYTRVDGLKAHLALAYVDSNLLCQLLSAPPHLLPVSHQNM